MSTPDPTFDATGHPFNLTLTGSLHPHLLLSHRDPLPGCSLQLAITLPDYLFPDPDELRDQWGAETEGAPSPGDQFTAALPSSSPIWWSLTPRIIDVERPELLPSPKLEDGTYAPVRLEVALAPGASLDLPLHLRYIVPSEDLNLHDDKPDDGSLGHIPSWKPTLSTSLRRAVRIFDETVTSCGAIADLRAGWACPGETGAITFTPRAVTPVPHPASFVRGDFPVAHTQYRLAVEVITAAVVWAGWAWIVFKMWRGSCRRTGREKSKVE